MINDLGNEEIILEIKELINCVDDAKQGINMYCELVKQLLLQASGQN